MGMVEVQERLESGRVGAQHRDDGDDGGTERNLDGDVTA
jgi:hypothetical protein